MTGLETSDGELIATGQGFELVSGKGPRDMAVMKTSASGTVLWAWRSGWQGDDVAATCVQDSKDTILVAGFKTIGGNGAKVGQTRRSLTVRARAPRSMRAREHDRVLSTSLHANV